MNFLEVAERLGSTPQGHSSYGPFLYLLRALSLSSKSKLNKCFKTTHLNIVKLLPSPHLALGWAVVFIVLCQTSISGTLDYCISHGLAQCFVTT